MNLIKNYKEEKDLYKKCSLGKEIAKNNIDLKTNFNFNVIEVSKKEEKEKFYIPFVEDEEEFKINICWGTVLKANQVF